MVITIRKDSKTLQVVSTTMTKYVGKFTRRKGRDSITVKYPKEIITHQKHMGGVGCGYINGLMGAGLSNLEHFKTWYKKDCLELTDFSLLQGFTEWNLAVNIPERQRRGGQPKFRELKNWKFYSIASEEMLKYVDNEEDQNFERVQT